MRENRLSDLDPDPLVQFGRWFADAERAGVFEPEAVALATAGSDGAPSARMVLLKGFDARGFRFFTNYESRKAAELAENPRAAMLFHWKELGRQIRIEGRVERIPRAESAEYFDSRSPGSRFSALASPQSRVIESRDWLERRVAEVRAEYGGEPPPAPSHWGGFVLSPRVYELWQHGEDRVHDRLRYRRDDSGGWVIERLAP